MSLTPRRLATLIVLSIGAAIIGAAQADELSDVQRLYYAGQTDAAMQLAERTLQARPSDPQLRFMKGVMLADAQRNAEARTVFEKLNDDYPDLAEPYNNLAALYAQAGDYPRARAALEQALRTNPGYATAHENLGDVYVELAAQAYARALQLDVTNISAGPKLALARQLTRPPVAAK